MMQTYREKDGYNDEYKDEDRDNGIVASSGQEAAGK